ncbi:testis-expressed protein 47-like [Epargyreus clarus]|uniref:testis-expressed protein 47-like n=1 Tax=Epargyreus clarus TaxID=520877 RepID=UPI003C2E2F26
MALPDLDVRSVLDVVEENFENAGLKSYAIRMIYIGEHALSRQELLKQFQETIYDVNSGYCDIHVNGLLLVYDSYFVHIVEGSEDTVHRHLRFLFHREEEWVKMMKKHDTPETEEDPQHKSDRKMLKRLKLLIVYHSIKTLLFDGWRALTARPPSLVGNLDVFGPLAEHMEQLRICLDKLTRLCALVKADETMTSFDTLSVTDHKMEVLPEVALLDFLLQSQHILDLRHVVHLHRRVDDYVFYFEQVWPLPTQFTPRLLYKLKIDDSFVEPLPVMPWEQVKKEAVEDEEREEQSGSSSD